VSGPIEGGERHGGYLYALLRAAARGDTATTRRRLRELDAARRALRPGDVSVDAVLAESNVRLAVGDSAGAAAALDRSLGALASYGPALLDGVPATAALLRAMVQRAELAAAGRDPATARRWALPVTLLWAGASAELRPVTTRMRQLAGVD
jgi:hypothetical protein